MKRFIRKVVPAAMSLMLLIPAMGVQAEGEDTTTAPAGYTPVAPESQMKAAIAGVDEVGADDKALLVMNVLPWGLNSTQQVLANLDIPYDTLSMDQVPSVNLDQYRLVIIANDQDYEFYNSYSSAKDELEDYVTAGGSLLMGIADQGYNGGFLDDELPGGVSSTDAYEDLNYIVDTDHPVVAPITNLNGSYTSHRHVNEDSLPAGSNVILRGSDSNEATLVEYPLGDGSVIASGLTWEFAYYQGWQFGAAYDDLIQYAFDADHVTPPNNDQAQAEAAVANVESMLESDPCSAEEIAAAQEAFDAAQAKVSALPDGEAKTALQNRLNAAQTQITQAQNVLEQINTANGYLESISSANLTLKTGIDAAIDNLNKAKGIFNKLPDGECKDGLAADINESQDEIVAAIHDILQTTQSGKPYILTGKQMAVLIQETVQQTGATSETGPDPVMDELMPIVTGHTNMSETMIRSMVILYLPVEQQPV